MFVDISMQPLLPGKTETKQRSEQEFSTKRNTQLRTNGQTCQLAHDELEDENDGYIIKITKFQSIHDTTVAAADEGIGVQHKA